MTIPKTITPSTSTETAPQSCVGDPLDIPDFLRRTPGDTKRRQQPRTTAWRTTPAMKAAARQDRERREKTTARPVVLQAVKDGADTFGKIRKATSLSDPWIQSALRFHVKGHVILKTGRRYHIDTESRR